MKIFRFFILPVLAMLSFSSYAIHVAAVHPNSEILQLRVIQKCVLFITEHREEINIMQSGTVIIIIPVALQCSSWRSFLIALAPASLLLSVTQGMAHQQGTPWSG